MAERQVTKDLWLTDAQSLVPELPVGQDSRPYRPAVR